MPKDMNHTNEWCGYVRQVFGFNRKPNLTNKLLNIHSVLYQEL